MKSYDGQAWYDGEQERMAAIERARHFAFAWPLFVVTVILGVAWVLVAGV